MPILLIPSIPHLYEFPKTYVHIEGITRRPLVSFCNYPVSFIASFILNIIKSLTNSNPKYTVKNSVDLVNRIKYLNLMILLDVSNLFKSVLII